MEPLERAIEEHAAIEEPRLSLSSYLLRFRKLCDRGPTLKSEVLESKLSLSLDGFRSILWSKWLEILSPKVENWPLDMEKSRSRFNHLKSLHLDDKRGDPSLHPSENNPLSQDGPWNQFFKDTELKQVIERDVVRSVSEEVRRKGQIKEWMSTILFLYGKEHKDLTYRQGMHEILSAILLLRLDEIQCCQKIVHGSPESTTLTLIQNLLNMKTIEHDVFALFEKIMEYMWDWYYTPNPLVMPKERSKNVRQENLFDDNNSDHSTLMISNSAKRLQNMWQNILQLVDQPLYDHLVRLTILPTTFGVNWTKLLFTRQITDFYHVWDTVIVSKFMLVDYIVVAMVLAIRSELMQGDSNKCNSMLVSRYPPTVCPRYITKMALHLQDSKAFKKPMGSPYIQHISYDTVQITSVNDFAPIHAGDQRKNDDLASKMRTHHQRIQRSLQDTKQVLAKSKCDNQAQVNTALAKMQAALDAMSQDLCQDQRHHKRSTSVAFDALAFDTKMQ